MDARLKSALYHVLFSLGDLTNGAAEMEDTSEGAPVGAAVGPAESAEGATPQRGAAAAAAAAAAAPRGMLSEDGLRGNVVRVACPSSSTLVRAAGDATGVLFRAVIAVAVGGAGGGGGGDEGADGAAPGTTSRYHVAVFEQARPLH